MRSPLASHQPIRPPGHRLRCSHKADTWGHKPERRAQSANCKRETSVTCIVTGDNETAQFELQYIRLHQGVLYFHMSYGFTVHA
jgi:hypothetical protein